MSTKNNKSVILWVAEAGLLIAMLVVVQLVSFVVPKSNILSQLFTGSLVNLVLIVGAATVGFSGAAIAALLSPVLAVLMGQMGFPLMIPIVMLGNLIIVAITWLFLKKLSNPSKGVDLPKGIAGIILGAAAKCAFLWAGTWLVMVPLIFSTSPKKVTSSVMMMFSWPQGVTALIGGILALLVLPAIRAYRRRRA